LEQKVEVLVEGKQKGKWYGRTITDKIVFFNSNDDWYGKLAILDIERTSPWSLQGRLRQ
jgi:tRNA-2-methylthio-N6-dimethylallyladenosine synthase